MTRREMELTLRAMEWRLRLVIVLAVLGGEALSNIPTGASTVLSAAAVGILAVLLRILHP